MNGDGWNNVPDALYAAYTSGIADERRRARIAADQEAFYGFPRGSVSTSNAGGKCVTAGETATFELTAENAAALAKARATHTINSAKTVAVATDTFWIPIDADTPRSVKLQLLGKGGVAHYGSYNGDDFWTHWCPLPKKRKEE